MTYRAICPSCGYKFGRRWCFRAVPEHRFKCPSCNRRIKLNSCWEWIGNSVFAIPVIAAITLWDLWHLPSWTALSIIAASLITPISLYPYITKFDLIDESREHAVQHRKPIYWTVCLMAIIVLAVLASPTASVFLSSDLVVIASIQESRIGEPPDRIDAYVPDGHRDQYYFVGFAALNILKGAYEKDTLGICLHSPALTFGIRDDKPKGRRYLLFLQYVVSSDGRRVLILRRNWEIH